MSDGRTIAYEYDAEERITKVVDSIEGTTEYTYDASGQLLTETTNGTAVNTMVYDSYGNILQKNGKQYVYDEVWKDRLAYYDGKSLTYDAQGNPTEYLGHSLTWEKGRQLKSFDNIQYTYNANGIRTSKTVAGIRHDYLLDGTKILKETWNDDVLEMLYDNEDSVCGIIYNGTPYYFLKNLQGDIISITNAKGETVARYSYDAWGICNILETESVNGSIANINPFRYRGYYYDEETKLYYLQSRYYNPTVGRFVNGDMLKTLFIKQSKSPHNLFVYCNNCPVTHQDCFGFASISVLKKESWISRLVLKYIPSVSYSKKIKTIFNTPKWLGAYIEVYVGFSTQTNPSAIIGFGFTRDSFDIGVSLQTGKLSTAIAVGISWTETYIQASLIFSSKKGRYFFSINFKLAIKHWLVLAAAALCYLIPALTPVAGYAVKVLCASARTAKPILCTMLPILLKA